MHISKRRLPSSPAEKHIDEIKNPSPRDVEKMFDGSAVIFDITESTKQGGRRWLVRRASLTLQLCLTPPASRAFTHFPARGCRCYNLRVATRQGAASFA